MAIAHRATNATGGTTAATSQPSITVAKPTGTIAGDVLVVIINLNDPTRILPPDTGWVPLNHGHTAGAWGQGGSFSYMFYKVATGSEPTNYQWHFDQNRYAGIVMSAFSGVDNSNPIDAWPQVKARPTVTNTAPLASEIETRTNGAMIIRGCGAKSNANTAFAITQPAGYTEASEAGHAEGSNYNRAELCYKLLATAGLESSATFSTAASATWTTWTFALKPADAGTSITLPPHPAMGDRPFDNSSQGTARTSMTINMPDDTRPGDLLLAVFYTGSTTTTWSANSGTFAWDNSSNLYWGWRIATANEPTSITFSSTESIIMYGVLYVIRGAQETNPIAVTKTTSGSVGTTWTAPSHNVTSQNSLILRLFRGSFTGTTSWNMTGLDDTHAEMTDITAQASTVTRILGIYRSTEQGTGATGTYQVSVANSAGYSSATLEIKSAEPRTKEMLIAVAASGDDYDVFRQGTSYPPSSETVNPSTGTDLGVKKEVGAAGSNYVVNVALLRFPTQLLPDDVNITQAALRLKAKDVGTTLTRFVQGEAYAWDGSGDWTSTAPASPALSRITADFTAGKTQNIFFSDLSVINKTSTTSLRMHISGGTPGTDTHHYVYWYAYDHTTEPPAYLVVRYEVSGPSSVQGFVSIAGDATTSIAGQSVPGYPPVEGHATIGGAKGTLLINATKVGESQANIAGKATVAPEAHVSKRASIPIAGQGTLAAVTRIIHRGTLNIAGSGSIEVTGGSFLGVLNTSATFGFPQPEEALTGEQTFGVFVRKYGNGANPTAKVEVLENGVLRQVVVPTVAISSTAGQWLVGTWDASILNDQYGQNVEMRIVGTGADGGILEVAAEGNPLYAPYWHARTGAVGGVTPKSGHVIISSAGSAQAEGRIATTVSASIAGRGRMDIFSGTPVVRSVDITFQPPEWQLSLGEQRQSFVARVRRQAGIPAGIRTRIKIDLFESGNYRGTVLPETPVNSYDWVNFEGKWDATVLDDKSGTGVVARFYSYTDGPYTPLDVAAIDWFQGMNTDIPAAAPPYHFLVKFVLRPEEREILSALDPLGMALLRSYLYEIQSLQPAQTVQNGHHEGLNLVVIGSPHREEIEGKFALQRELRRLEQEGNIDVEDDVQVNNFLVKIPAG